MPIILFVYYAHGSVNYYSNLLSQYARAHEQSALWTSIVYIIGPEK